MSRVRDDWTIEAWNLPGVGTFEKKEVLLPVVAGSSFRDPVNQVGRGTVILKDVKPEDSAWDPSNILDATGSSLFVWSQLDSGGTPRPQFAHYARRKGSAWSDDAEALSVFTGDGVGAVLDSARILPYDWPPSATVKRTIQPDWIWGGTGNAGSFTNGGMEDVVGVENPDFESGTVDPWIPTPGSGDWDAPDSGPEIESASPITGTYSGTFDPDLYHSGARRTLTVEPGGRYTVDLDLECATVGKRFTMGVKVESGYIDHSTNGFIYNGYLLVELDNVVSGGGGLPPGSTDGTVQHFAIDVTVGTAQTSMEIVVQYDHHDATDGPVAIYDNLVVTGPGLGLQPWERVETTGTVDTFEQSNTHAYEGTYSAKLSFTSTVADDEGIRQKITELVSGVQYYAEARVLHDGVGTENFTLQLRRANGAVLVSTAMAVPTGVGSFTIDDITGVADTEELWLELLWTGTGSSPNVWVEFVFAEGLPKANPGEMAVALMADFTTDHTAETPPYDIDHLGFVKVDFTGVVDSNGVNWSTVGPLALRVKRGQTMRQALDQMARQFGVEWKLDLNPDFTGFGGADVEPLRLRLFVPYSPTAYTGGLGTDLSSNDTPKIRGAEGMEAGDVVTAMPSGSWILAEGKDGRLEVDSDATSEANFGMQMLYVGDNKALDADTVAALAAQKLLERVDVPDSAVVEMIAAPESTPYMHYTPGDTVNSNIRAEKVRRVWAVTVTYGTVHRYTVEMDKGTFGSGGGGGGRGASPGGVDPALAEAVRRLYDRFEGLDDTTEVAGVVSAGDVTEVQGATDTYLVAGDDSRDAIKAVADFLASGTADEATFSAAITAVDAETADGVIVLAAGTYVFSAGSTISIPDGVHMRGNASIIHVTGAGETLFTIAGNGSLIDVVFFGDDGTDTPTRVNVTGTGRVARCRWTGDAQARLTMAGTAGAYAGDLIAASTDTITISGDDQWIERVWSAAVTLSGDRNMLVGVFGTITNTGTDNRFDVTTMLDEYPEETSPADADLFFMRKDADGKPYKVQGSNLPGSGGGGAGGSGTGWEAIETIDVGVGGLTNIDFIDIPGDFEDLKITGTVKDEKTASVDASISVRLGDASFDTGTNYDFAYWLHYDGGGDVESSQVNQTNIWIGSSLASSHASNNANDFSWLEMFFPQYTRTDIYRIMHFRLGQASAARRSETDLQGLWTNTADPISRIRLYPLGGTDFAEGSRLTLWGRRSTPPEYVVQGQKLYGLSKRKNGHAKDDDFDGATLDPKWSVVTSGSPTMTATKGEGKGVILSSPGGDTLYEIQALMQAYAPAGDFTIEAGFEVLVEHSDFPLFALVAADGATHGAGNQHVFSAYYDNSTARQYANIVAQHRNQTNYSAQSAQGANGENALIGRTVFLRLAYDSATDTWTGFVSNDGIFWKITGATQVDAVTVSHVGVAISTMGGAGDMAARVIHFYVYETEKTEGIDTSVELAPVGGLLEPGQYTIPRDSWLDATFRDPTDAPSVWSDYFAVDSLANYTKVEVGGTFDATITRNRLSLVTTGVAVDELDGLYAAHAIAIGDAVEICVAAVGGNDANQDPLFGPMISDGVVGASNVTGNLMQNLGTGSFPTGGGWFSYPLNEASTIQTWSLGSGLGFSHIGGRVYYRVEYDAANTFKRWQSTDGVHWYQVGGTMAQTMTPTHIGVAFMSRITEFSQLVLEYIKVVTV